MNKILIGNNKAFEWVVDGNIHVVGMAFLKNQLLQGLDLINYFKDCTSEKVFLEKVKKLNGFYSVILNQGKHTMIASDRIRSFPLFYKKEKNYFIVTDDLNLLSNKDLEKNSIEEFMATGFVTNNYTLYRDIYQTENGTCVFLNESSIEKINYSTHKYKADNELFTQGNSKEKAYKELNAVFESVVARLIEFLDGRTALIPLSGGHDSRILAYYLKKLKYEKVITYTYGRPDNPEATASKLVAGYLGYEWHFVPYKNKDMQKMYNDKKTYSDVAEYCGKGYSVPHIQEWRAIDYLMEKGVIDNDAVVIPGFTGDFLAGGHIPSELMENKKFDLKYLKELILNEHYKLYNWSINKGEKKEVFISRISESINFENESLDPETAIELYEKFDFQERQTKFISNAVRIYEYYGLKWYMPFWDLEMIEFWLTVPILEKFNRSFFKEFTDYQYKELMNYAPIYQTPYNKVYKVGLLNNLAKISRIYTTYSKHFINYYGYIKFYDYLMYVATYKTSSYYFMFSHKYVSYLQKK